ncbi:hypothetical protein DM01DRAFT_198584 [Hesseltinella vesiculosa]|uniref:PH domain-containing protein n=1 Tax=Hesseltinella vesiculosa TaxID=101127 RepID=A0A1X2GM88_9FUNG|nr:hypothetical protein DM01DRAFT_198584 [Hesseltinella vesiculosa]
MLPLDPNAQGRLYIRVIAAENLDFPIDKDGPIVKCALSDGIQVQESQHSAMGHDIHFEHDFVLENVALSVDLTLTLHAMYAEDMQTPQPATSKRRPKRTSFTSRAHDDDLARYINPQDGSLAQTRFSPGAIGVECINKVCTASFVLVNGWYRPVKRPGTSMFLGKAKRDMKSLVQEKAVGKITMELFFIPQPSSKIADLPMSMEGCEHAVNMQRFLSKVWQAGYMSQLGGDVKSWRRAYFKLKGGQLYRFSDSFHSPRAVIDLSRASGLVVDGRLVVDAQARQNLMTLVEAQDPNGILVDNQGNTSTSTIVSQATQQQIMFEQQKLFSEMYAHHPPLSPSHEAWDASSMDCLSTISISQTTTTTADSTMNGEDARLPAESDMPSYGVKNSFQLRFEDGQIIDFFTDSLDERDEWLRLFKAILGRVPKMPSWLA